MEVSWRTAEKPRFWTLRSEAGARGDGEDRRGVVAAGERVRKAVPGRPRSPTPCFLEYGYCFLVFLLRDPHNGFGFPFALPLKQPNKGYPQKNTHTHTHMCAKLWVLVRVPLARTFKIDSGHGRLLLARMALVGFCLLRLLLPGCKGTKKCPDLTHTSPYTFSISQISRKRFYVQKMSTIKIG